MNELREYKKQLYTISITRVCAGLCIYNTLDHSNCMTTEERCYVATGRKGEQWPIREKDLKKYLDMDGNKLNPADFEYCVPVTVQTDTTGPHILAYIATEREAFPAPASWGMADDLVAEVGDAVAFTMKEDGTPNEDDKYRIEGATFLDTYELA